MTTIVAVFTEGRQARQAVLDLVTSGVPHEDISILTADTHGASAHDHLGEIVESLGAPSTLTISEIGPLIAAGAFAAALVGTSAGAGDLLDLLLSNGVSAEQAHGNIEGLRLGGTLIAVQSDDVRDILVLGVFRHNADPTLTDEADARDPRPERQMMSHDAPVTTSIGALTGGMIPGNWGAAGNAASNEGEERA